MKVFYSKKKRIYSVPEKATKLSEVIHAVTLNKYLSYKGYFILAEGGALKFLIRN